VAIIATGGITLGSGALFEARGGDGQTPGQPFFWSSGQGEYAHAGGGGGSGGTVYLASNNVTIAAVDPATGAGGSTFDMRGGMGGGYRSQNENASLFGYPEYYSVGSFGGNGGYGRLVVEYTNTLNNGKEVVNRWGMEPQSIAGVPQIDAGSNTYRTLAGTARFLCPGLKQAGTKVRSKWYDLGSIVPTVDGMKADTVVNAVFPLLIEGAQSHPNNRGSGTGEPDANNTSGMFSASASLSDMLVGWRWIRFSAGANANPNSGFTRLTDPTGGEVPRIDDIKITYTKD
jgi:hypothetical protein